MNRKVQGPGKFLGLPFEPQPGRWLYLLPVDRIALRAWYLHDEMVLILLWAVKLLRVPLHRFFCFSPLGFSGSLRKGQPLWYEQFGHFAAAAAAESLQSCPTLCNPIDGSPPGCPVPGILQARTLEWVAISFSNAWKWKVKVKSLSRAWPSVTPWTAAFQAPPSMGLSRQEYWSGVPLPSPLGTLGSSNILTRTWHLKGCDISKWE